MNIPPLIKTVSDLIDQGITDIPLSLIAEEHSKQGYATNVGDVFRRRSEITDGLFLHLPKFYVHPVPTPFFKQGGSQKVTFDIAPAHWIESVDDPESPYYDEYYLVACSFLPVRQKTDGFRVVTGSNDYQSFVWAKIQMKATAGKVQRQIRKDVQALQNRHWPTAITHHLIGTCAVAIPRGINGTKGIPQRAAEPLLNLQDAVNSILKSWRNK